MKASKYLKQRALLNRSRYAVRALAFDVLPSLITSLQGVQQSIPPLASDVKKSVLSRETPGVGEWVTTVWDPSELSKARLLFPEMEYVIGYSWISTAPEESPPMVPSAGAMDLLREEFEFRIRTAMTYGAGRGYRDRSKQEREEWTQNEILYALRSIISKNMLSV